MTRTARTLILILALTGALLACRAAGELPGSPAVTLPAPAAADPQPPAAVTILDLAAAQDALVALYARANPGVVAINITTAQGGGNGSGFVWDRDGHIVTNHHVVEGADTLEVAFASGRRAHATVVGIDVDSDLAVVHVDVPAAELTPLPVGDSDQARVGQTVLAIGNPFGLEGTMTMGIISALGRTLASAHTSADGSSYSAGDILQTDAPINPGNSGGPLLNLQGEVIGINQAIRTSNGLTNSGVGFAISINIIKRVVPALIADGRFIYPYMGLLSIDGLSLAQQEALGLDAALASGGGVYVTGVTAGGPAARAGLQAGSRQTDLPNLQAGGDLIVAVDGRPVKTYNDLIGYLTKTKSPGDTITLSVIRGGERRQFDLTLAERPSN